MMTVTFHCALFSCKLSSLSAIKIKSCAYSNSRGKPARSSVVIINLSRLIVLTSAFGE